jgi:hypothetical protein
MKLNKIEKTGAWSGISATLNNNFQRVENAVEALNYATRKNKGYFKTLSELQNAVPTANKCEIAYVGIKSPYAIYEWNVQWVNTGETHADSVELGNYYTKEETNSIVPKFVKKTEEEIEDMIANGTWEDGVIYYTEED